MAAPSVTARVVPTGYKLPEGFKIAIALSLRPAINMWETGGSPAGGTAEKINTTTQHNTKWETFWISALVTPQDVSDQAGYDPDAMDDLIFCLGAQSGSWTVHMPQNTKYAYWGGLTALTFQPLKPRQFPLVNYTLASTCWDPVNRVEAGPATTQAVGT
jgi:hypothetical protein